MEQLVKGLLAAAQLDSQLTGQPVDQELVQQLKLWGAGIFRLVVMGEIKKGKSSFINAMLGTQNLVPVSSDVATSTVYKIRYGKELGYRVHFAKESGRSPQDINGADLELFGTETGNPGNVKQVSYIEVMCPSPILKSGLVIIDTPGLGGLFKYHRLVTYEYVPKADAVFFVTDSVESPIGLLETEYLKDIRKITPYIYFVQTKCGAVDIEARDARKRNNLSILSTCLDRPEGRIPYFLLDAEIRFMAEEAKDNDILNLSGYPQLLHFINATLLPSQKKILADKAIKRMAPSLQHITEILASRQEVLQSQTEEQKKQLAAKLEDAQQKMRDWDAREKPEILSRLQRGLQEIRFNALDCCARCRPNGEIQNLFEEQIYSCADVEALQACLQNIEEQMPGYAAEVGQQVTRDIKTAAEKLLSNLVPVSENRALAKVDAANVAGVDTTSLERLAGTVGDSTTYDTLRTTIYGGVAGATIFSIVGGLVGSVIPVVGTIAGSLIGTLIAGAWGGHEAYKLKASQELKGAKQQACNAVSKALSSVYQKLQTSVERLLADISSRTTTAIQDGLRMRQKEMTDQLATLRSSGAADSKAVEEKRAALAKAKAEFAAVQKAIKPYMDSLKRA